MAYLDESGVEILWEKIKELNSESSSDNAIYIGNSVVSLWKGTLENNGTVDVDLRGYDYITVHLSSGFGTAVVKVNPGGAQRVAWPWVSYDVSNFSLAGASINFNSELTQIRVDGMYYWNYITESGNWIKRDGGEYPNVQEICGIKVNSSDSQSSNINIAYDSGWILAAGDYTGGTNFCDYRKVGKMVTVRGRSNDWLTIPSGDYLTIATLPEGFRPTYDFPIVYHGQGGDHTDISGWVRADGRIQLYASRHFDTGKYWAFGVTYPVDSGFEISPGTSNTFRELLEEGYVGTKPGSGTWNGDWMFYRKWSDGWLEISGELQSDNASGTVVYAHDINYPIPFVEIASQQATCNLNAWSVYSVEMKDPAETPAPLTRPVIAFWAAGNVNEANIRRAFFKTEGWWK